MKSDNSTWLRATQDNCEDVIAVSVKNILPPLTPGFSQCMVLNMSGSGDDDLYYAASCEELHPFLCQSQDIIGIKTNITHLILQLIDCRFSYVQMLILQQN